MMQTKTFAKNFFSKKIEVGKMLRRFCPVGILLAVVLSGCAVQTSDRKLHIDADYPGGNIIVERLDGDDVYLRQDMRDSTGWWFYWNFRVRGAAGRTLSFHFTNRNVIGTRGPAVSLDEGLTWAWLGTETVQPQEGGVRFVYRFAPDAHRVRFAFAIPYLQADLERFLRSYSSSPDLVVDALCTTPSGRTVERLSIGPTENPNYRLLLTCRQHACESTANFVLEGILAALLAETETGRWFRRHVETIAIPFMDKDGVEDGDQGKNRAPHDHNRDFGINRYASVRALSEMMEAWPTTPQTVVLDLHCPMIRGRWHEKIFLIGNPDETIWHEQLVFGNILEEVSGGNLPYKASNNLPYGQAWNTMGPTESRTKLAVWACGIENVRLSTTLEIPYANAQEVTITPDAARAFGADMAMAIRRYFKRGE